MHPVQSICITCDTSHSLCGPCAMDALSTHSRVALTCRNHLPGMSAHSHHNHSHHHSCSHSLPFSSHEPRCSGCGALAVSARLAAPPHASPHAEALSLSIPVVRQHWDDLPLRSPRDWLSSLAPEIVKHVDEAPVFHLVYDHEQRTERQRISESEASNPDSWPEIRRNMMQSNPDAVVFVHELDADADVPASKAEDDAEGTGDASEVHERSEDTKLAPRMSLSRSFNSRSRTWGLVVLGRSSKHSCYILQTSKVFSSVGATTHFSLTKAKCFAPSLHKQMEQAWLVGGK